MNRCPITYEITPQKYSARGLKLLSRNLKHLNDFPYTPKEQIQLAAKLAEKMSIQGVQPKLSVKFSIVKESFEIVEKGGTYILKPPNPTFDELPQNEDLTMKMAALVNIEVPFHGMIYDIDGSLTYFIKRFDRIGQNRKLAVEDFSQLLGFSRETKYESSMEQVATVIEKHCTFPVVEKLRLFRLVIFNFLVGNEDMHLKNFSLIRRENKIELSPAYDLVNSTIVMPAKEEIALPLNGKKNKLNQGDLIDYFGGKRLGIPAPVLVKELSAFEHSLEAWKALIENSFLSEKMQLQYKKILAHRWSLINRTTK